MGGGVTRAQAPGGSSTVAHDEPRLLPPSGARTEHETLMMALDSPAAATSIRGSMMASANIGPAEPFGAETGPDSRDGANTPHGATVAGVMAG